MTDEELITRLRDACRGGDGCKCSLSEAADRIEALVKEQNYWIQRCGRERAFASSHRVRAERLEAALRAIQTYLQEPAPENKLNDLRNDLRWIGNRARAALKGADHDG